ncbi:MAG: hypothetical protein WD767_10245 [Alphaproteobacteria bacterium]
MTGTDAFPMAGGVPAAPRYYRARDVWPVKSHARWRDCLGKGSNILFL